MASALLAATGLKREAALIASPGVKAVVSGGDGEALLARLQAASGDVRAVVSVGVGGGLSPAVRVGDWVVADHVVEGDGGSLEVDAGLSDRFHKALTASAPPVHRGPIAAGGVIVATAADKAALHARTGALAVDMESHVAARFAAARGLPFAALRVISDAADHALPKAVMVSMRPDGGVNLAAVVISILKDTRQIPALIRTGREAEVAFAKLKLLGRHDLLGRLGVGDADLGQLAFDVV